MQRTLAASVGRARHQHQYKCPAASESGRQRCHMGGLRGCKSLNFEGTDGLYKGWVHECLCKQEWNNSNNQVSIQNMPNHPQKWHCMLFCIKFQHIKGYSIRKIVAARNQARPASLSLIAGSLYKHLMLRVNSRP